MANNSSFSVSSTLKSGILVLIPTIILYMLGEQLVSVLLLLAEPFDAELPESYILSALIVIAAIIVAVFLAGLLARTRLVQSSAEFVEERILSLIPGYNLVRQMALSKLDESEAEHWPAVVIEDGSGYALGVLVDETDDDMATVYLPLAPQGFSGITRVVPRDRLRRIKGKDAGDVIDLCLAFGQGTASLTSEALKD